ncbi:MAG: arsenite methyltransferase [Chloroflexi bacterium]|nr:arsenite methyltransferase [Chloroflexota bacterium]
MKNNDEIRNAVREHYGQRAKQIAGCCSGSAPVRLAQHAERLYSLEELSVLPQSVTGIAAGCGNPTALAALKLGDVVLDLGSGGGIDCFLAAQKVGLEGKVIGVDMTPEMLQLAKENADKMQARNVEFRLGEIEHLPVPDNSVDVVISNCVINLSPDKPQVFRETYRVLKPGGRIMVSDIVLLKELPESVRNDMTAWSGCVAGASGKEEYLAAIAAAGFKNVEIVSETASSRTGELASMIASVKVSGVRLA